ncbi:MAG: SDR family oxidoreductase [Deltaproteobacteria bacterium]|nr:SDR family oxidoreductase [Deltaproteobacteria bacterium]
MSSLSLSGKTALITGAGRGIGAAAARLFAASGARVVLLGRGSEALERLARELNSGRSEPVALAFPGDVSLEATFPDVFAAAEKSLGPIDIVLNCAGLVELAPLAETSVESWDRIISVNLRGSFLACREMFRQAARTKRPGCVVNLSSLGGIRGTEKFPGTASYVVSKHGVVGLTEIAAVEGKPLGVRVNCVAPGAVDTEMLRQAAPFLKTQLKPEDLAQTLLYLCDDRQSGKISGTIVEIFSNE